jgi:alcohol dehydrogenase (cytochrome c)
MLIPAVLWNFNTGSGLRSGIVSYAVDGKQYILVPSGWGSFAALFLPPLFPQLAKVPQMCAHVPNKLGSLAKNGGNPPKFPPNASATV